MTTSEALKAFDDHVASLPRNKRAAARKAYEKARETHSIREAIRIVMTEFPLPPNRSRGMMTNWNQIRTLAGPNPETFPAGEQVYLFSSMASVPSRQWLNDFTKEAEANGLRVEVREDCPAHTMGTYYLFVVVPS